MNTPGGNTISTAQLALALLASLSRFIPAADASIKQGKWDKKSFTGVELFGKTIGVVGCGRIGQVVAGGAQAVGMKVLGYDPVMSAEQFHEVGITHASLVEIWAKADFITFHTPLTAETKDLFNDETIAKCKKGVRIVNCARGGIVNEAALLRGLNSGHVAGAALDVFTTEPPSKDPELKALMEHPNLVCTPHLGASTDEAQLNVAKDIAVQMCDAFDEQQGLGAADYYFSVVNAAYLASSTQPHMPPFMDLAETVGSIQCQMLLSNSKSPIKKLTLKTHGAREVSITTKPARQLLEASVLRGLLRSYLKHLAQTRPELLALSPDLVSSPSIAKDLGIECFISGEKPSVSNSEAFWNLLSVDAELEDGTVSSVTGTVFGSTPHIVKVDQQETTFRPEGSYIVTFKNVDRPGAIAEVLSVMSKEHVNVASMTLARPSSPQEGIEKTARCFISIDDDISDMCLSQLKALPFLSKVAKISLR